MTVCGPHCRFDGFHQHLLDLFQNSLAHDPTPYHRSGGCVWPLQHYALCNAEAHAVVLCNHALFLAVVERVARRCQLFFDHWKKSNSSKADPVFGRRLHLMIFNDRVKLVYDPSRPTSRPDDLTGPVSTIGYVNCSASTMWLTLVNTSLFLCTMHLCENID